VEKEDPNKYDILDQYDFAVDEVSKQHIVNYNENDITLYEIFGEYGTSYRPKPKFPEFNDNPKP
jgi:hypothetical protein